jgi:hypothetical protein
VLWALGFVLLASTAFAADTQETPLAVRAIPIAGSDGQVWRVNVTLGNPSKNALSALKVAVFPVGAAPWEVPTLSPGEWKNGTIDLTSSDHRSLAVIVTYSSNSRTDSLAELIQVKEPEKPWWSSVGSAAAPVLLGAMIGLLGAFMTSLFTMKKERLTAQLQWSRFLVEHYDVQYRTFLTRCAGVVEGVALMRNFTQLDDTALVPNRLRELITRGIQTVDNTADANAKRAARDKFLEELRSELLEPLQKK